MKNEDVYDDYDKIIDEDELSGHPDNSCDDEGMGEEHWAIAFAMSDSGELDENKPDSDSDYALDAGTDEENFRIAMQQREDEYYSYREPSNFDRIIRDICRGKRSLFDLGY